MKRTINFRFTPECHAGLVALSESWGVTRTAVIERLVAEAAPVRERATEELKSAAETIERLKRPTQRQAEVRPRGAVADPQKLAEFQKGMGRKK